MRKFLTALVVGVFISFGSVTPASAAACTTTDTTVTISGQSYELVTISSTGSCTWTVPDGVIEIDFLIVAGGGGGGGGAGWDSGAKNGGGGGGGAGGLGIHTDISATPSNTIQISVGAGGARGASGAYNTNGGDGLDGGNSSIVISGTTYSETGGSGGQGGRETGGLGGNSGDGFSGGSVSGKQAGSGGSSEGSGSATTALNGGTSSDFSGSSATYSSGGGGGNATQYGANPTGTPGSGGYGGRGSQQTPTYNYGYPGGAGANGLIMIRYKTLTAPGSPTQVSATSGYLSANVSWTAPTNVGNTSITGYKVEMQDQGGWTTIRENTASTGTSLVVQNLKVGLTYRFRVTAINIVGASSASQASAELTVVYHSPPSYPIPSVELGGVRVALSQNGENWDIEIHGRRLNSILTGFILNEALTFDSQSDALLSFSLPLSVPAGSHEVRFNTTQGMFYLANQLVIPVIPETSQGESPQAQEQQRVSVGSFKGYVAVYTLGYNGSRLSAKIGNDWLIVESIEGEYARHLEKVGSGVPIVVRVYLDRELVLTQAMTTS